MSTRAASDGHTDDVQNDANNNNSIPSPVNTPPKSSRWPIASVLQTSQQEIRHIPRFIFDPDSSLVFYWTAAVAVATLYNTWTIALRIAFPEIRQENGHFYLSYLDMLSDVIYLLDILVQLRTAYLQDGIPVFDSSKIRQQYTSQTHFVQDVICILPSQTILSFLPDAVGCCKYYLCTAGAARLTRLLKFHVLYKFYNLAESFTSNPHLIRVLCLFLNLAIIIHWIACLYYLLSEYEGLGSNQWVYTNSSDQQRFSRKYIVCLYWSTMTLTTIGNTNSPETDLEYVFTGVIFMTGVFVFATVMGNVGDVISSMNANRQEFQARMDHIQMYLTHKKVPASLQLKIKKWAEYTWSRTKATDESRLLNMLPERLRAEVAVHVHLDSLKKVKIFEQCETGFLCELVLKLRSQVFSPGDYVCRVGETGREMFIINHGKVEVLVPSPGTNKDMVVAVLSEGNYFGEISLLRLDGVQNRRTADVRSIGYSELLCLSRRDLMAALVEYPEAKSILEAQAKKRMKTNLQAQRAFSVDTLLRNSQDYSSTDSGILSKDENRGHDVSEIKAMIEELKNASKVPGRTVWQLITRCEVLQTKLLDKEKEVEDSKQRIKELEELLFSRFSPKHTVSSPNSCISSDIKHLRPSSKVIKQYSQDEGRHYYKDANDSSPSDSAEVEKRIIPDVKVTRAASEADSSGDNDLILDAKHVFGEDNFIKTSKISNIHYSSTAKCNFNQSFSLHRDSVCQTPQTTMCTGEHSLSEDTIDRKFREIVSGDKNFKFVSQNILDVGSPLNYEASLNHELFFDNGNTISFKSNFNNEICLSDSLNFNVHTIPEEREEEVDVTSATLAEASNFSFISTVPERTEEGSTLVDTNPGFHLPQSFSSNDQTDHVQDPSEKRRLLTRIAGIDNSFQSDTGISFLKLSSLSDCNSEDSSSRRNSSIWDSECDTEEEAISS